MQINILPRGLNFSRNMPSTTAAAVSFLMSQSKVGILRVRLPVLRHLCIASAKAGFRRRWQYALASHPSPAPCR